MVSSKGMLGLDGSSSGTGSVSNLVAKTLGLQGEFRGEEACLSFPPGSRFDARDLEIFVLSYYIVLGFLATSVIYR